MLLSTALPARFEKLGTKVGHKQVGQWAPLAVYTAALSHGYGSAIPPGDGRLLVVRLLLDRGSASIDAKGEQKTYPHLLVVLAGNASWRLAREAFRSSWSRYAWHRSHIQQLLRARTKFQITATARAGQLGRAKWSGDGPGRRRPEVRVAWDSRSSPFFIPGSSREGVSPSGTPTPSAHTRRPRRPRRVRGYR